MDWIFDHLNVVIVLGFVIASLAKHLLDAKTAERETPDEMSDEEEVFGPDQGWPQAKPAVPPPLVRHAPPPPPPPLPPSPIVRAGPPQHSREYENDVILKRQQDMQDRIRQIKESKANTTGGASATRARVAASQSNAKTVQPAKASLGASLRNPREIRRAVVMREILGPPLGLR
jgi:hypothetical protein